MFKRNNGKPAANAFYVMLSEIAALIVAVLFFVPIVSGSPHVARASDCDLGAAEWVPYVAYRHSLYCGLDPRAADWTLRYYAVSLGIVAVAHIFYVHRRPRRNLASVPKQDIFWPAASFVAILPGWLFGLDGSRARGDNLTTGWMGGFIFEMMLLAVFHAGTVLAFYERRRPSTLADSSRQMSAMDGEQR